MMIKSCMKKYLMMLAAILSFCGTIVLTSCNNEENSKESQELRSMIQNTHWKMTEIYTEPDRYSNEKEWISASNSSHLMIYDLSFDDKGTYTSNDMHYSAVVGRNSVKHSGEYHVVGSKIYMRVLKSSFDAYGNYNLNIRYINNDVMEAELNWLPIGKLHQPAARVSLPDSLKSIGYDAFRQCVSLDSIYIYTDSIPSLESGAFRDLPASFKIFVPRKLAKLYRTEWAEYADHIVGDISHYSEDVIEITTTNYGQVAEKLGLTVERKLYSDGETKYVRGVYGNMSHIQRLKINGPIGGVLHQPHPSGLHR